MFSSSAADRLGGLFNFASGLVKSRKKPNDQLIKEHWETIIQWYKDKGFEWVLQSPTLSEINTTKSSSRPSFRFFKSKDSSVQCYANAVPVLKETPISNALDQILNIIKEEFMLEGTSSSQIDVSSSNSDFTINIKRNSLKKSTNLDSPSVTPVQSTTELSNRSKSARASSYTSLKILSIDFLKKMDFFRALIVMADFNVPVGMHCKIMNIMCLLLTQIQVIRSHLIEDPYERKNLVFFLSNSYNTICVLRKQSKNDDTYSELEIGLVNLIDALVDALKYFPEHVSSFSLLDNEMYFPRPFLSIYPLLAYLLDFIDKDDYLGFLARDVLVKGAPIMPSQPCPTKTDLPQRLIIPLTLTSIDLTLYFAFLSKFCFAIGNSPLTNALASILPFSPCFFNVKPIYPSFLYSLHRMAIDMLEEIEKGFTQKRVRYPSVPEYKKTSGSIISLMDHYLKGPKDLLENYLLHLNLDTEATSSFLTTDVSELPFSTLLQLWGSAIDSVMAHALFKVLKLYFFYAPREWVSWLISGPGTELLIERTSFLSFSSPRIAETMQMEFVLISYAKSASYIAMDHCDNFFATEQIKLFDSCLNVNMELA